jgi:hypothetical protein
MQQVAVITENIRFYFEVTQLLNHMRCSFLSLIPQTQRRTNPGLILTTKKELSSIHANPFLAHKSSQPPNIITFTPPYTFSSIEATLVNPLIRWIYGDYSTLIIGVDPGQSFGIVAMINNTIVDQIQAISPRSAATQVKHLFSLLGTKRNILKIGKGAKRLKYQFLVEVKNLVTEEIQIEEVDEFKTNSIKAHRKKGYPSIDLIAASNIAKSQGTRQIRLTPPHDPKIGEIKWIQQISRIQTQGKISIPRNYAIKVLMGSLSLQDAIKEFKQEIGYQD